MFLRLIIVITMLAIIFGGIFGWKSHQQQLAAAMQGPPPPASVAITQAKTTQWQSAVNTIGTLVAAQGIQVTAEVAGIVREIQFESGQSARQGEVLLRLDDTVDRAELRGFEAEQQLARIKYRRLSKLVKERSVSQADVDEARAELDNTTALVASKQAVIDKKAVTAPFAGQLGIRAVDVGEYLQPGVPIVQLEALDPLYIDFSLPEREIARAVVGQQVTVAATAVPQRTFIGTISAIDPAVDVTTRTIRLRATLPNPERLLRPGMFVDVRVQQPVRSGVLIIPRLAVTYAPYGDAVFVLAEADGQLTAKRRQISTGTVNGDDIEVLSGLEDGERVVLAGHVKLRNGQAVQIDNEIVPGGGELGR